VEELASRLGKSRSEVYREALADYVVRREPDAVTEAINAVAGEINKEDLTFLTEAARQLFARTDR
jgi:predicted transcriptional regulator